MKYLIFTCLICTLSVAVFNKSQLSMLHPTQKELQIAQFWSECYDNEFNEVMPTDDCLNRSNVILNVNK